MLSRRAFLNGASVAAFIAVSPAFAWVHGNAGIPKVQVGVSSADSATFKNFMSILGSFQPSTAGYAYPAVLNADQYPVGTIGSTLSGTIFLPSNLTSGDTLVLAWTGTATNASGAMSIQKGSPGFTVTAGSGFVVGGTGSNLNVSGTNGYIEFNFAGTPGTNISFLFVNGSTFTGLSGLIFCRKSDYASIIGATNAGQLINTDYINSFKALHLKCIRMMPWTNPNNANNFTQHQYRGNWQTALRYTESAWIPNCWAGSSSGTNAYTAAAATDTPGSYTMGEVLQLQFINASTLAPLTINVNSRGIVPLFDMLGAALTNGSIPANALATLIYDDLLGGYLATFSSSGLGGGLTANIPVEVQVGLANQVGVPMWYNFPPHIVLSSVTSITSLIASTLNAGCYFEYANEIWNTAFGFQATTWAAKCGAALGFPNSQPNNYDSFYGFRTAVIMPLVVTAWGGKSGLKCVSAFQAFGGSSNVSNHRLKGTDLASVANGGQGNATWISYTGNANYTASPNRPVDVVDALSYATYYSGAQCAGFDNNYLNAGGTGLTTGGPSSGPGSALLGLLGAADAYASGDITNAVAWLDWDIRQGTNNGTAGGQTLLALKTGNGGVGIYPPWETVAASFDGARPAGKANLTVECYEGAMECAPPSTGRCTALSISTTYGGVGGKIDNLLTGYKNSATFYATVQQQITDFLAQSHSKSASWFVMTGGSQWSMYAGDVYQPVWQSYAAVRDFNNTP